MALTTHASQVDKSQTPYKIDPDQTLRASQALLKNVRLEVERIVDVGAKKNLLAVGGSDDEEEDNVEDATPIWLTLATKQYIADKNRLKPSKIAVPHSLNQNQTATICLITTDPQRTVKNAVADSSFPKPMAARITRIIGFTKLLSRYKSFEQKRQLLSEHDIFLADDRIIARLPKALGKVFYKGTSKRPIPINIAPRDTTKEKNVKKNGAIKVPKDERQAAVAEPNVIAKEIEKALACIPVNLSPGYNIAVRVGLETFTAEQLKENITTATSAIIDKHVVSGWKNVKSVHIKSPTSIALPIWLAEDLFIENNKAAVAGTPAEELADTGKDEASKKRKRKANSGRGPQSGERKKTRVVDEREKEKEAAALRKTRLSAQKSFVFAVQS